MIFDGPLGYHGMGDEVRAPLRGNRAGFPQVCPAVPFLVSRPEGGSVCPTTVRTTSARAGELRFLATRLTEALRDVLRVAESRGERLPAYDASGDAEPNGHPEPTEAAESSCLLHPR